MKNMKADIDLENKSSLQRGARLFSNYCLSCHSADYMRYNRMAVDLGLSDKQVEENLMFASDKVGETMTVAMTKKDGEAWFGTKVPDLTVIARSRGTDWLYTYLKTFYLDDSRPYGMNNQRFPSVGMPHVLWELEGLKKAIYESHTDAAGKEVKTLVGFETVVPGKMSAMEYDSAVTDLVNFMTYMGEPVKLERQRWGILAMLFLALLFVVAYALKKEYWKDIH
ncbi:MAG: cytochrome c1 [Gammaproteobacteria bacterium]